MPENQSSIILYQTPDGQTRVEVKLDNETVWLTQAQMCELFDKSKGTISEHISNIFNEGELDPKGVVRNFRTTATDRKSYNMEYYNLDVIISVGYRVKSQRGTQFRIWATERLREYIIKGFTMDDARLKEMGYNNSYFEELLERIRDIRTSEKNFYYKVREIYKLSADYEEDTDTTQRFFREIQNKFHYAIHGHTAAEIIHERVDAEKLHMGLTTWKNQGKGGKVRKDDIAIAKNYLSESEIKKLNLLVEQFLAFAETQAMSSKVMYMRDWIKKLGTILEMNDMQILENAGTISHNSAQKKAETEYEKYKKILDVHEIENLRALESETRKFTSGKKKSTR
ncbi:MAG: virulence RhuM family protein [Candidatus Gracilibacteria bacterium]|nr:virulence RhuM family protein [Candidatus Gracilibacteria bacterium]